MDQNQTSEMSDINTVAVVSTASNAPVPYQPGRVQQNVNIQEQHQIQFSPPPSSNYHHDIATNIHGMIGTNDNEGVSLNMINNGPSNQIPTRFVRAGNSLSSPNNEIVSNQVQYQNTSSNDNGRYFLHGRHVEIISNTNNASHRFGSSQGGNFNNQANVTTTAVPAHRHSQHVSNSNLTPMQQQFTNTNINQFPAANQQLEIYNNTHHHQPVVPMPSFAKPPSNSPHVSGKVVNSKFLSSCHSAQPTYAVNNLFPC